MKKLNRKTATSGCHPWLKDVACLNRFSSFDILKSKQEGRCGQGGIEVIFEGGLPLADIVVFPFFFDVFNIVLWLSFSQFECSHRLIFFSTLFS